MDSDSLKTVWRWVRGLVALALLAAIIVVAFMAHASWDPPPKLIATLSFLMATLLAWLLWIPPQPQIDRYWIAWSVFIVVLLVGGVSLLVNP